ncbi:hypothetical protein ACFTAO_43200 [Paenibacillus rhizoplanae]
MTYEAGNFLQALKTLTDGTLMERVQARRSWSGSWNMEIQLQTAQLKSLLNPEWEKKRPSAFRSMRSGGSPEMTRSYIRQGHPLMRWTGRRWSLRCRQRCPPDWPLTAHFRISRFSWRSPLAVKQPKITLQALKDQGIDRKIVQFSTSLGASGPGRSFNVEAAAKAVNGTVLPPNAVFLITEKQSRRPRPNTASAKPRSS